MPESIRFLLLWVFSLSGIDRVSHDKRGVGGICLVFGFLLLSRAMTPRKKRSRYQQSAMAIAAREGLPEPKDWEETWALLDKYEEPTYVYAIVDYQHKLVKFGKSKSPGARLSALKTGNGVELALWGFCEEQGELTERGIHKAMQDHRVSREWFYLNGATQAVINQMRSV